MAGDMRRETVIVVHGTFDAPEVGSLTWYQPNWSFCKALDRALEPPIILARRLRVARIDK